MISSCWFWSLFLFFSLSFFVVVVVVGFELGDWLKFIRNCLIEREELGEMKWHTNEKKVVDWILVRSCICELIQNMVKYILNHFLFFIRKTNLTKGYDYVREFIKVDSRPKNLHNIYVFFYFFICWFCILACLNHTFILYHIP